MMSSQKRVAIAVMSVFGILCLAFGVMAVRRSGWIGPGMMGWFGGGTRYGMMGGYGYASNSYTLKTDEQLQEELAAASDGAQADESTNSVRYEGDTIRIIMLAGPEQADEKFVINGLINPTLYVSKGATVTLTLVNQDEGMPHAFEITNAAPPYIYMAMMSGGVYPGTFLNTLPQAGEGQYPSVEITFTANYAGTYYYICQYPGHAEEGMYGMIVVE